MSESPRQADEDAPPDDEEVTEVLASSHTAVTDFDELLDSVPPDEEDEASTKRDATEEGPSPR